MLVKVFWYSHRSPSFAKVNAVYNASWTLKIEFDSVFPSQKLNQTNKNNRFWAGSLRKQILSENAIFRRHGDWQTILPE